jgi:hypothetical protein
VPAAFFNVERDRQKVGQHVPWKVEKLVSQRAAECFRQNLRDGLKR